MSWLYKFCFCLCLPFVSNTFYRARMIALAIAECTESLAQIQRVLRLITNADITVTSTAGDYILPYGPGADTADMMYSYTAGDQSTVVPYSGAADTATVLVVLNGASRTEVEAYLQLLIPFYVNINVVWTDFIN